MSRMLERVPSQLLHRPQNFTAPKTDFWCDMALEVVGRNLRLAVMNGRGVSDLYDSPKGGVLTHGATWGGHPVTTAVAVANISAMRENVLEHVSTEGPRLLAALSRPRRTFRDAKGLTPCSPTSRKHSDPKQRHLHLKGLSPSRSACQAIPTPGWRLHPMAMVQ
jgi:hypothetical protein